ncbi:MAG: histidine phosphatase family protein [Treponema sp.]|nr:histidine phosphatase family protein [Treponema sp.]
MKLYLLRHGETDWNKEWRLQGLSDISLNENGIAQAKEAAQKYAHLHFDYVFSSPLQRALNTARILAEPHGLEVQTDERLCEICLGDLEGKTVEETDRDPLLKEARTNFFDHPELYVPTGNGESFEALNNRCLDFLNDLRTRFDSNSCILLSGHGALCKGIVRAAKSLPVEDFWKSGLQNNCGLIELEI